MTVFCSECYRPWGIILPRRHTEVDVLQAELELRRAWREWCSEMWTADVSGDVPCPTIETPTPNVISVVHVSEADWRWLETIGHECNAEPDTWMEADSFDGPAWWVNQRRRFALHWECCMLDDPRNHPLADQLESLA